jgi:hypothetical protein
MVKAPIPRMKNIKGVHYFDRQPWHSTLWYRSHFPISRGAAITGEASPYYLYHPRVPARAARTVPHARLVVLLRDPAERAYSHFRDEVKNGRESLSFAEAVAREQERIRDERARLLSDDRYVSPSYEHHTYVTQGLYAEHLSRWLSYFPREQLHVAWSADFFDRPREVHRDILGHLGLEGSDLDIYARTNASEMLADDAERRVVDQLREWYEPYDDALESLLSCALPWRR